MRTSCGMGLDNRERRTYHLRRTAACGLPPQRFADGADLHHARRPARHVHPRHCALHFRAPHPVSFLCWRGFWWAPNLLLRRRARERLPPRFGTSHVDGDRAHESLRSVGRRRRLWTGATREPEARVRACSCRGRTVRVRRTPSWISAARRRSGPAPPRGWAGRARGDRSPWRDRRTGGRNVHQTLDQRIRRDVGSQVQVGRGAAR